MSLDYKKYNRLKFLRKKYDINVYKNTTLVKFDDYNSKIVEKLIPNGNEITKKYESHFIDIFNKLKNDNVFDYSNLNNITEVIKAINKENGTRDEVLSSSEKPSAVESFSNYINNNKDTFLEDLKKGNIELVDKMTNKYIEEGGYRAKSLASKICKYFCELEYGEYNFFIRDQVVTKMLPAYLKYFDYNGKIPSVSAIEKKDYKDYYDLVNFVYEKSKTKLDKSKFDHLIWYCYKPSCRKKKS